MNSPWDLPFFETHHRELASSLSKWVQNQQVDERDDRSACREWVLRLAQGGWLRYCVPRTHGGALDQLDSRSLVIIRETLAWHSPLADFSFAMQGLGSGAITLAGSASQQAKYLPQVAQGLSIAAFALSEPQAGSDVASMQTTAVSTSNGHVLNGIKTWISNGGMADFYVVFARTGEAPGARGISAFIVDADSPGLEIAERIDVMAPHPLATLQFNNVLVPHAKRIGAAGEGFKVAMATLDVFRTSVAAASLGFARRALD
ncbi:MAG: acyl-CoA dehydrogenase, partial [Betaproteobacteria bacterium]|nr:acyl-CoA dehydrogenase [Betaproteobacteria bacterium]